MTTPAELRALAERVVKLEKACRYIDAQVGATVLRNGVIGTADGVEIQLSPKPRRYTASLDAAVALVPEGDCWMVMIHESCGPIAEVGHNMQTRAATPALALTAAALLARASMMDNEPAITALAPDGAGGAR